MGFWHPFLFIFLLKACQPLGFVHFQVHIRSEIRKMLIIDHNVRSMDAGIKPTSSCPPPAVRKLLPDSCVLVHEVNKVILLTHLADAFMSCWDAAV